MVNIRSLAKMAHNADLLAVLADMKKYLEAGQEEMQDQFQAGQEKIKKGQECMIKGQKRLEKTEEEMKNQNQGIHGMIEEVKRKVRRRVDDV
ncbi:hypothetical protein AVEN_182466-1 [Araneus ventricosus]|uniref:Uncharacterized protein n=1 Tax=Araneus ventricosus TaxID=182803 RepID=A0A4Y2K1T5_ARAVE|nr:hypothetical protein AVEN_182466-1 [Araneus ventricosus]